MVEIRISNAVREAYREPQTVQYVATRMSRKKGGVVDFVGRGRCR